ncbi:MAG TPA: FMN-binding protein [Micromonosporaceae bacterium]|jgi:uncharacterized protein with FMN-binding domain
MRRILAVSGGAAVGAAAVLAGHALAPATGTTARPDRAETSGLTPGATASSAASPTAGRPRLADGTATGPLIETFYGPVQVRITVVAGTMTEIVEVKLPFEHLHSRWIRANLVPQLRQRVLTAQSADVDVVSGATYTGQGYLASLQGALDQLS